MIFVQIKKNLLLVLVLVVRLGCRGAAIEGQDAGLNDSANTAPSVRLSWGASVLFVPLLGLLDPITRGP